MNMSNGSRRPPWPGIESLVVVAAGSALAILAANLPPFLAVVLVIAMVFLVLFLQRPEYGLLIVLLVRASFDLSITLFGQGRGGDLPLGALPNIALMASVIFVGGLFILARGLPLLGLPAGRLMALFLLGGLAAAYRADIALLALSEWLAVLASFVIYVLSAHLFRTPRGMQTALDVVTASFIVPAVFGFLQLIRGEGVVVPGLSRPRILGTFVHPNSFGFYLVAILAVFLVQFLSVRGRRRAIALIGVVATTFLLLATFARVAWAGAMIVVFTIAAFRHRALFVAIPVLAVLVFGLVPPVAERLADPLGGSFEDRFINLWPATVREWKDSTSSEGSAFLVTIRRLTGLGPGMGLILSQRGYGFATPPHNDYLRVLVEYGIFGLVMFISLLGVLVVFAFRTWLLARPTGPTLASVSLAFFALSLAFPIMSLTDNVFGYTVNQVYFWGLAGLTVAAHNYCLRLPHSEQPHGSG